jgi:glycosyltransferase involved in cell wall biosynthesis
MAGLVRFFRREQVDAVLLCLPRDVKAGGVAARLAGVRDFIYRRGIAVPVRDRLLNVCCTAMCSPNSSSFEKPDAASCSTTDAHSGRAHHLIHNGFDVAEFDARPARHSSRAAPANCYRDGRAADPQKGQHLILEAAALLQGKAPPFRVLVAGCGDLEQELKSQARALGLVDASSSWVRKGHEELPCLPGHLCLPSLWEDSASF